MIEIKKGQGGPVPVVVLFRLTYAGIWDMWAYGCIDGGVDSGGIGESGGRECGVGYDGGKKWFCLKWLSFLSS